MCPHTLWGDADGLACTQTGPHTTHVYAASAVGDAHDESEARAEAGR
jgi:hypothetical protein